MANTHVGFSIDDGGFDEKMRSLKRTAQDTVRGIIEDNKEAAKSGDDLVKSIEAQIKVLERRDKLEAKKQTYSAEERYNQGMSRTADPNRKMDLEEAYKLDLAEIKSESRSGGIKTGEMREMIDLLKEQTRLMATQETIAEAHRTDVMSQSPEDSAKTMLLRDMGKKPGASKGGMGGMMGGLKGLGAAALGIGGAAWVANNLMSSYTALAGAETGELYDVELLKTWLGPLGSMMTAGQERHISSRENWERAAARGYGATGEKYRASDFSWAAQYGYAPSDVLPMQTNIEEALGFSYKNLENVVQFSKAYNVEQGQMAKMVGLGRYDESNFLASGAYISSQLSGDDRADVTNVIEALTQLTQSQLNTVGQVNTLEMAQTAMALRGAGGAFGGDLMAGRMQRMQGAITGTGNEYQQALKYQMLREINPEANWWEIKEMQEMGIYTPGFMGKIFERAGGYGKDINSMQFLSEMTGLGAQDTRTMWEYYKANPSFMDRFKGMSAEQIEAEWVKIKEEAGVEKGSAKGDVVRAVIDTAFIESAKAGMEAVAAQSIYLGNMSNAVEDLKEGMDMFGKLINAWVTDDESDFSKVMRNAVTTGILAFYKDFFFR